MIIITCSLKEFVQKCALKRHEQTHLEDKLWECDFPNCGKRFKLRVYLDVHKRIHPQLEPQNPLISNSTDLRASRGKSDTVNNMYAIFHIFALMTHTCLYSKVVRQQIVRQFTDHTDHVREFAQALELVSQLLITAGEVQQAEKLERLASKHAMALWGWSMHSMHDWVL